MEEGDYIYKEPVRGQRKVTDHGALHKRQWRKHKLKVYGAGLFMMGALWMSSGGTDAKEVISITNTQSTSIASPSEEELSAGGGPTQKDDNTVRYAVAQDDIPAEIFSVHGGLDANDVAALLSASKDVYDFTRVQVGREIVFTFEDGETRAAKILYEPNGSTQIIAVRSGDEFTVAKEEITYDITRQTSNLTIVNSLYVDALNAGISEATVIGVGEVFSYSIDFASEVQKGDTLRAVYEKRTRDGSAAKDGKVLAAVFTASGKEHYAYYFDADPDDDEFGGYYDEEARVLERQFLKAPLDFFRITSGFTGRRLHPVTNKFSAHYQIDYAAPQGTPTFATGRGTVVSAGWENGWGNIVRLKHDNGYTTHYAHLSGFAKGLKSGKRVAQSEVIGFVGSTGWSTGPHVDYGMKLEGAPINPLKIELPKGAPIDESQKAAFEQMKEQYDVQLKS